MKVENMTSSNGNAVPNQFIITGYGKFRNEHGEQKRSLIEIFQSYETVIAKIITKGWRQTVFLDKDKWDYSITTGKYRNQFLRETIAETRKKSKSGEYKLVDLNK